MFLSPRKRSFPLWTSFVLERSVMITWRITASVPELPEASPDELSVSKRKAACSLHQPPILIYSPIFQSQTKRPLPISQEEGHSLEDLSLLWPPLSGKVMQLLTLLLLRSSVPAFPSSTGVQRSSFRQHFGDHCFTGKIETLSYPSFVSVWTCSYFLLNMVTYDL